MDTVANTVTGKTTSLSVFVIITTNASPVIITPIADVRVDAGTALTILDLAETFDDVDIGTNGDALTLSIDDNSNPDLVTATLADTTLVLDYRPGQLGTATITVRATDSAGAFVDESFDVQVLLVAASQLYPAARVPIVGDSGGISSVLGNGDGTFQVLLLSATRDSIRAESAVVADVDRDGIPDLVVPLVLHDLISVLLGVGDGTFEVPQHFASGFSLTGSGTERPDLVEVTDLNADGRPDLVVTEITFNQRKNVAVLLHR